MSFSKSILNGFVDMHVHAGPSVAVRKVDADEMMQMAGEAGYRAFLVKDHYFPTMMGTKMITEHHSVNGCECFGGLALNRSVGLFNVYAVDAACNMAPRPSTCPPFPPATTWPAIPTALSSWAPATAPWWMTAWSMWTPRATSTPRRWM